ncbi:hypothetical protein OF83DRAFT_1119065 [Amylostereum chailletii]|nr:hypothetical protein OF83DRAFT_1119065 [Amylostereum chailletii]
MNTPLYQQAIPGLPPLPKNMIWAQRPNGEIFATYPTDVLQAAHMHGLQNMGPPPGLPHPPQYGYPPQAHHAAPVPAGPPAQPNQLPKQAEGHRVRRADAPMPDIPDKLSDDDPDEFPAKISTFVQQALEVEDMIRQHQDDVVEEQEIIELDDDGAMVEKKPKIKPEPLDPRMPSHSAKAQATGAGKEKGKAREKDSLQSNIRDMVDPEKRRERERERGETRLHNALVLQQMQDLRNGKAALEKELQDQRKEVDKEHKLTRKLEVQVAKLKMRLENLTRGRGHHQHRAHPRSTSLHRRTPSSISSPRSPAFSSPGGDDSTWDAYSFSAQSPTPRRRSHEQTSPRFSFSPPLSPPRFSHNPSSSHLHSPRDVQRRPTPLHQAKANKAKLSSPAALPIQHSPHSATTRHVPNIGQPRSPPQHANHRGEGHAVAGVTPSDGREWDPMGRYLPTSTSKSLNLSIPQSNQPLPSLHPPPLRHSPHETSLHLPPLMPFPPVPRPSFSPTARQVPPPPDRFTHTLHAPGPSGGLYKGTSLM